MATVYVLFDAAGGIRSVQASPAAGLAPIDDADPRIINFLNQPEATFGGKIAAGLAITSAASPAIAGTYAIDDAARAIIGQVAAGIGARQRLPGGGATFNHLDIEGVPHPFSAADFVAFAQAVEDYYYE